MTKTTGLTTITRISTLPGLSPRGRLVIARLENGRLQPGQVLEAIRHWERFVRDPAQRLYDPRYTGCGIWECCSPRLEVQAILHISYATSPDETAAASKPNSTESANVGAGDRRTREIPQMGSASMSLT